MTGFQQVVGICLMLFFLLVGILTASGIAWWAGIPAWALAGCFGAGLWADMAW